MYNCFAVHVFTFKTVNRRSELMQIVHYALYFVQIYIPVKKTNSCQYRRNNCQKIWSFVLQNIVLRNFSFYLNTRTHFMVTYVCGFQ